MAPQMFSFVDLVSQILQFLNTRLIINQRPVYKSLDTERIEVPRRTQQDEWWKSIGLFIIPVPNHHKL